MQPRRAWGTVFGFRLFDLTANRLPLTAITCFLLTRAGYRTWRRISRARTGWKDCHRPSRQKGSGSGRREQQRRELEGSAVPTIEAGEALDHFGLGAAMLGVGEDVLQARLGLFEGGQDLTAEERDQGGGQRRRRLPAFTAGALFLDRKDHLMVTKELKSLTDRAFANPKAALDMVEIQGSGGHVEQGVDFGDRTRDT
ncbi:MAG: hypothetical protein EBX95_14255 [Acidimicrobiia bacterium]|nr:hypothetical protein [Acidimicrobiia bacterium]